MPLDTAADDAFAELDAPAQAPLRPHLCRLRIINFRNFAEVDVELGPHAVVVGENRAGKTNLIHALRLVLDTTLPESSRSLLLTDFNDDLPRPLGADASIEVSVELAGFDDNDTLIALLADSLVQSEPMVARLTYRFEPKPELGRLPRSETDYRYSIFGGDRTENRLSYEIRRQIAVSLLPALRDASGDLERWSRSPLRRLIEDATSKIDAAELKQLADGVRAATQQISDHQEFMAVADEISGRIEGMTGPALGMPVTLGLAPTEVERLARSLRVLIDDGQRPIDDASLGSANILYLILRLLELERLQSEGQIDLAVLAIEEPEAHLHPSPPETRLRRPPPTARKRVHRPHDTLAACRECGPSELADPPSPRGPPPNDGRSIYRRTRTKRSGAGRPSSIP